MKNISIGGMQSSAQHFLIYCPKCQKAAARVDYYADGDKYLHYTKKGSVVHIVKEEA